MVQICCFYIIEYDEKNAAVDMNKVKFVLLTIRYYPLMMI